MPKVNNCAYLEHSLLFCRNLNHWLVNELFVEWARSDRLETIWAYLIPVAIFIWTFPLYFFFTLITEFAPILDRFLDECHMMSFLARNHLLEWIPIALETIVFTAFRADMQQPITLRCFFLAYLVAIGTLFLITIRVAESVDISDVFTFLAHSKLKFAMNCERISCWQEQTNSAFMFNIYGYFSRIWCSTALIFINLKFLPIRMNLRFFFYCEKNRLALSLTLNSFIFGCGASLIAYTNYMSIISADIGLMQLLQILYR